MKRRKMYYVEFPGLASDVNGTVHRCDNWLVCVCGVWIFPLFLSLAGRDLDARYEPAELTDVRLSRELTKSTERSKDTCEFLRLSRDSEELSKDVCRSTGRITRRTGRESLADRVNDVGGAPCSSPSHPSRRGSVEPRLAPVDWFDAVCAEGGGAPARRGLLAGFMVGSQMAERWLRGWCRHGGSGDGRRETWSSSRSLSDSPSLSRTGGLMLCSARRMLAKKTLSPAPNSCLYPGA
ncbi:hypothetical protein T484DRAFT_3645138 [Baffinella frigidus]|nr:hypothetical protein T484DRAFT_3645138 [Cryptophyta sp. CCMP2293]